MQLKLKKTLTKKYQLYSGDELLLPNSSIEQISKFIKCTKAHIYTFKYKNINQDNTWSFNFGQYNYTIKINTNE